MTHKRPGQDKMREEAHALAEYILKYAAPGNRSSWLAQKAAKLVADNQWIEVQASHYAIEYPYSDIDNPYLVEATKSYFSDGK